MLCEPCFMAWQRMQQPFVAPPAGVPSPAAAAVLGLIPGVGAMYNGQFFKGLIHVVIFAMLVTISGQYAIFGIFIAAWILYQSFEAYHTAIARRDGLPLPDPLGLNEVGNWLNLGMHSRPPYPGQPGAGPMPGPAPGTAPGSAPGFVSGAAPGPVPPPYEAAGYQQPPYQPPYQAPYQAPYPPMGVEVEPPPVPPVYWKRKEPIGAVILIGFGLILLMNQMGFVTARIVHFLWPLIFIGLGAWLIVRRVGDTKGGPQ